MIHLTELLHAAVLDNTGRRIGRISELALTPADDPRLVSQFVVRDRKRRLTVSHDKVAQVSPGTVRLSVAAADLREYTPRDDQLLITKDLLDQQIIDVNGRKVVRVNDVTFHEQRHNGTCEVRLAEVDVGLAGALRRLMQGILPAQIMRRIEKPLSGRVIPWEFVDLIEVDPQRRVKLRISHEKLERLHPADLADIVEELAPSEREAILETIDEAAAAEALSEVEPKVQKSIIEGMDTEKAADILEEMAPDEAADLLAELPEATSDEILEDMQPAEAEEIGELMEFEEDTAGGMMTTDFIAVPETATVGDAVLALRECRDVVPAVNTIFLKDGLERLTGAIPLAELFFAAPSTPLMQVLPDLLLFAHVDSSEHDVFELFDKYNLLTLPVVDKSYRLVGMITADDVISRLKAKV